jgi:hypothetical protein
VTGCVDRVAQSHAWESRWQKSQYDVVLNQILVSFGTDTETDRVIAALQSTGVAWMGGTTWHNKRYMRISLSNHQTTPHHLTQTLKALQSLTP